MLFLLYEFLINEANMVTLRSCVLNMERVIFVIYEKNNR